MARRLWGCYSVADHLEPRAFVADLLLYDRLVVPVPAKEDRARWEKRWDPDRQDVLLKALGGFVERIEWSASLRDEFDREWSPGDVALDIDASPYGMTRRIISEQLQAKIADQGDVRAVAVYTKPDRFDREWRLTRALPFVRRSTRMTPGVLREATNAAPAELQQLAKLVVTRLVVPDDGQTDEEVLKRTVKLVKRDDVAERRAAFHQLLASLDAEGLRDETIIGEVEDKLEAFNEAIRRNSDAKRARVGLHVLTAAESAVTIWAPPARLATGPAMAIGGAEIQRRWGAKAPEKELGAVSLLAEAQHALAR